MSESAPSEISLRSPGELIAAVPYLVGFHPSNAVVIISLSDSYQPHITSIMSHDLPPATDQHTLAQRAALNVAAQHAGAVVVLIIGDGGQSKLPLPHQDVADTFTELMTARGIEVVHCLWAAGVSAESSWQCYDKPECRGLVPSSDQTPVAAASVAAGRVTYSNRAELDELLRFDEQAKRPELADEIDRFIAAADKRRLYGDLISKQLFDIVDTTIDGAHFGTLELDHMSCVMLIVALSDLKVRDACITLGLTERAAAAEQVWIALLKATPPPYRVEPALLLAASAYLRGNQVLADAALTEAISAQPDNVLALVLRLVVDHGLPVQSAAPDFVALALDAQRLIDEEAATYAPLTRTEVPDEKP